MKNLMIYISPTDSFHNPRPDLASNDAGQLVKVQIDNSIALGWKKEDILLVTNFDYQYGAVKATVLKDVEFFERKPQTSKINAIIKLFENGMIRDGELYWFHDIDAYQLEPIDEVDVDIPDNGIGVTDYGGGIKFGGEGRWSTGTIFFKAGAEDIFRRMKEVYYEKKIDEEEALGLLTIGDPDIRKRVKKIDSTYNFTGYGFPRRYKDAIKPLKVAHFHPWAGRRRAGIENCLRFFKGENELHVPLIADRLADIFNRHGIA